MNDLTKKFFDLLNKDFEKAKVYQFQDVSKKIYICNETKKVYHTKKSIYEKLGITRYKFDKALKAGQPVNSFTFKQDVKIMNMPKQICTLAEFFNTNEKQENVFYAVNEFNHFNNYEQRKNKNFQLLNAFYADVDFKDKNGNHLHDEELRIKKQETYNRLINLELKPSAIIESRNGFHVYYILKMNDRFANTQYNRRKWERQEEALLFNLYDKVSTYVDFAVSDISRILRIPESIHHKTDSSAFEVKVLDVTQTYTLQEIEENFPYKIILIKDVSEKSTTQYSTTNVVNSSKCVYVNELVNAMKNKDINYFSYVEKLNVSMNMNGFITYVKSYDMREFFDIDIDLEENFCSLFRDDRKASCTIQKNSKTECYYYKDFADVDKSYSLIDLFMKYSDVDFKQAVKLLAKIFDVELTSNIDIDTEHYINDDFISHNISVMNEVAVSDKKIKFVANKNFITFYKTIFAVAEKHAENNNEDITNVKVELASKFLANIMKKDRKNVINYLYVCEALQIIKRVTPIRHTKSYDDINTYRFNKLDKDELTQAAYELKSVVSNVFRDIRYKNVEKILLKKTNCLDWAV